MTESPQAEFEDFLQALLSCNPPITVVEALMMWHAHSLVEPVCPSDLILEQCYTDEDLEATR